MAQHTPEGMRTECRPEDLIVEFGRRNPNCEHNWEVLSTDSYQVVRPTVFCFSGNGTVSLRDANGFCKQVEGYLKLMFDGKDGVEVTDKVDLVGFKYATDGKAWSTSGTLTTKFVKSFVNNCLLPMFKDVDGTRLTTDEACRRMSQVSFFTYCAGAQELSYVMEELNFRLREMGYFKDEINRINNTTMNVSYAPIDAHTNHVPSVRILSYNDEMIGEDIRFMLSEDELRDFDGIKIFRDDPGKLYGMDSRDAYSGSINILTSSLLNAVDSIVDEHFSNIVARDENWNLKAYDRNGKAYVSSNADCVSQMMAWSISRAVDNSLKNARSNQYIPNTFYDDNGLKDELQSILHSFTSEQLAGNPELKAQNRRASYIRARSKEIAKRAKELKDFHTPESVVHAELMHAKTFQDVATILEKNNYYYVDELLPEIDFLTDDEKTILMTSAKHRAEVRLREIFDEMPLDELLTLFKSCKTLDEISNLASKCKFTQMKDLILPWLAGQVPDKKYPFTQAEAEEIINKLQKKERKLSRQENLPKWDCISEDLQDSSGSFEDLVRILEEWDYYAVEDILPSYSNELTPEQKTSIIAMGRAKKAANRERAQHVEFPTYNQMVDKLNNAGSYEEVLSILQEYNYCGVEYVLPEVIVLTDEEKEEILQLSGKMYDNENDIIL